nr:hypothetical protein [Kibdelosporangium sp. MJ126-NF4]
MAGLSWAGRKPPGVGPAPGAGRWPSVGPGAVPGEACVPTLIPESSGSNAPYELGNREVLYVLALSYPLITSTLCCAAAL